MNWFYAQDGRQMGPVDEGELEGLVKRGDIIATTLVWRMGLAQWQPYAAVRPPRGPLAGSERPAPGAVRCAECGGVFPPEEVVRLAGVEVCAGCKPIFVQKLREGVPGASSLPRAGFWIRFAALVLDALILAPAALLFWGVAFMQDPQSFFVEGGYHPKTLALRLIALGAVLAYEAFFVGRYGATPGKMICDLQVVRADGARLTYHRAFARGIGKWVSQLTFYIGFLMAAFDPQRRALHDHICDTRVTFKR